MEFVTMPRVCLMFNGSSIMYGIDCTNRTVYAVDIGLQMDYSEWVPKLWKIAQQSSFADIKFC